MSWKQVTDLNGSSGTDGTSGSNGSSGTNGTNGSSGSSGSSGTTTIDYNVKDRILVSTGNSTIEAEEALTYHREQSILHTATNRNIFGIAEEHTIYAGGFGIGNGLDKMVTDYGLTEWYRFVPTAERSEYGGKSHFSIGTGSMLDERDMSAPQNVIWDASWPNGFGIQKSTRKLKHDIIDLDFNADEFFKHMRPVSFKWNGTDRLDSGFIAEEVAEFDSRLVAWMPSKDEESGEDIMEVSSVNYDKITAYLVKVVGDLREEVKSLKDEIKKLK